MKFSVLPADRHRHSTDCNCEAVVTSWWLREGHRVPRGNFHGCTEGTVTHTLRGGGGCEVWKASQQWRPPRGHRGAATPRDSLNEDIEGPQSPLQGHRGAATPCGILCENAKEPWHPLQGRGKCRDFFFLCFIILFYFCDLIFIFNLQVEFF